MFPLIHPEIKTEVYLGLAALASSIAAVPQTSSESIKIIAMTTISGFGMMLANYMMTYHGEKIRYLTTNYTGARELSLERYIRSSSPFVNHFLMSAKEVGAFAAMGCCLAFAARVPIPRLTAKIDARDLKFLFPVVSGISLLMAYAESRKQYYPIRAAWIRTKACFDTGLYAMGVIGSLVVLGSRVKQSFF